MNQDEGSASETNRIEGKALRDARGGQIKAEKRVAELEKENARLVRQGVNAILDTGAGSDLDEALDRLLRKAEKRIEELEEALRGALYVIDQYQWAGPRNWVVIEELTNQARTAISSKESEEEGFLQAPGADVEQSGH